MPLLWMVRLWASDSGPTSWYKRYPTKCSAEIICSGHWLLCCSSSGNIQFRFKLGLGGYQSTIQSPLSCLTHECSFSTSAMLFRFACKQINHKKATGQRANPPPLLGPISSWIERKASPGLLPRHLCLLSQLSVWERGRRLVLRPLHLPCRWAYPNSERSDRSWKNSPSQELGIFDVLLLFTASRPSSLPTAELGRNSLHYLLPCFSCHFY